MVLIESDWNLKSESANTSNAEYKSINRIRLEFKGHTTAALARGSQSINRIRLEFKDADDTAVQSV